MAKAKTDFREELANAVRDVGQDLINNAEDYVGNTDLLRSMTITISFEPNFDMKMPTIVVDKDYLCKAAYERLMEESKNV